jgi:ATP-binding cassette subfamily F protein 3
MTIILKPPIRTAGCLRRAAGAVNELASPSLPAAQATMLGIRDITFRIGDRLLFDQAGVTLPTGARVGLVGRNGVGKTTLFRIIAGELPVEGGVVMLPRSTRIGQVAQEAPGGPETLLEIVLAADAERRSLLAGAETERDPHRIAEIHTRLAEIDAHSAEARAAAILAGLGFTTAEQARPCSSFSGGWRMRVALAAALFAAPDLLLLDEPTNYLDLEGTLWLNAFLARYRHTVIVISHDRTLLDAAVDMIVHLDAGKLTLYRGGYSQFERQRGERQALQLKLRKKQLEQRRHMEAFVERFRAKATKARQAQSRLKALERMVPIPEAVEDHVLPFSIPDPARPAAPPLVAMDDVSFGYVAGAPVFRRLKLTIGEDDRIGLLGRNGNGKSTLAQLLTGRLEPLSGRLRISHRAQAGYFAQHQLDELDPDRSPYDHVRGLLEGKTEAEIRARAGALGFPGRMMDTPAAQLSGGEKARLLLGLATFGGVHLLILDEPTNHLDIDSREMLIQALNDFSGALILISHDRHLLDATVDRLWLVADGGVRPFDGSIDDYRQLILGEPKSEAEPRRARPSGAQQRRRAAAQRREETAPLRRRIKALEAAISRLHREIERLDAELADPRTHRLGSGPVVERATERAARQRELAEAEEDWLKLSEVLENEAARGEPTEASSAAGNSGRSG